MQIRLTMIASCFLLILVGCGVTPYGPAGATGGYTEEKIDEYTYVVSFSGNGYTSRDMVWYYWMYRCAELTMDNGFSAFSLGEDEGQAMAFPRQEGSVRNAFFNGSGGRLVPAKGDGGYYYYYMPGGTTTVTTYTAKAVVTMFNPPYLIARDWFLLDANKILESLKPYVESGGKSLPPREEDLIKNAVISLSSA